MSFLEDELNDIIAEKLQFLVKELRVFTAVCRISTLELFKLNCACGLKLPVYAALSYYVTTQYEALSY